MNNIETTLRDLTKKILLAANQKRDDLIQIMLDMEGFDTSLPIGTIRERMKARDYELTDQHTADGKITWMLMHKGTIRSYFLENIVINGGTANVTFSGIVTVK